MSASIYYPGIEAVASDLDVSKETINLTMTSFKIAQGIAPLVTGSLSDHKGRRLALMISLILYIATNIAIALQPTFAGLVVLRSVQGIFSSTIAIVGAAVAADVASGAERGKYMAYTVLGATVGPALGPAIGGILIQYLGWRSTFGALAIFALAILLAVVGLLPETCRAVVGDGSLPPPSWNRPICQMFFGSQQSTSTATSTSTPSASNTTNLTYIRGKPGPWQTLAVLRYKKTAATILFSAIIYAGYISITTTLPFELGKHYHYNALQIGLCYLSYGGGSFAARWTAAPLTDWNFARLAQITQNRDNKDKESNTDPTLTPRPNTTEAIPISKARLQIALPLAYAAAVFIIVYSWVLFHEVPIAVTLLMLFCVGHMLSGTTSVLTTLLVDFHPRQPATAAAAANFVKCMLGAGATAAAVPLIVRVGVGWAGNILALGVVGGSLLLWGVYVFGEGHRLR